MNSIQQFSSQQPRFLPERGTTFAHLEGALSFAGHHYTDGHADLAGTIQSEVARVADGMSSIPGFKGCFGLGYPYYAYDQRIDTVYAVPEIGAFVTRTLGGARYARSSPSAPWPCVDCQRTQPLPDLKSQCKPCERTLFKPRELFKALPDIDVVLVIEGDPQASEHEVSSRLQGLGLRQSDTDIRGSVNATISALSGDEESRIPVDAHIWPADELRRCCELMIRSPRNQDVIIRGRSLHSRWEDNPLNFWFDFVFSMTAVSEIDSETQRLVDNARQAVADSFDPGELESAVRRVSARAGLILDDSNMRNVFHGKVLSWKS